MTSTHKNTDPSARDAAKPKQPWLWNVVLLDDDDHTYEYVIDMCQTLFAHDLTRAFKTAERVDADGRAVLLTTHRELAELKLEQIKGFGADGSFEECEGSMTAIIEPAEGGGE